MKFLDKLPTLLPEKDLKDRVEYRPTFEESMTQEEQLCSVLRVYDTFYCTNMALEIYYHLYFALLRSFQRKERFFQTKEMNTNRKIISGKVQYVPSGINADSTSLISGEPGCGKSYTISRIIDVIGNDIIEDDKSMHQVIKFLMVECPAGRSFKGLLFSILSKIDFILNTNYLKANDGKNITLENLTLTVCNILILHVGVLVLDESDRIFESHRESTYFNFITELINNSGIGVVFVGTTKCLQYFSQTPYLSRRTTGMVYRGYKYDSDFVEFVKGVISLSGYKRLLRLSEEEYCLLYKYSRGLPSFIVELLVECLKIVIKNNSCGIDKNIINEAHKKTLQIIQPIEIEEPKQFIENRGISEIDDLSPRKIVAEQLTGIFTNASKNSLKNANNAIALLKDSVEIVEIDL